MRVKRYFMEQCPEGGALAAHAYCCGAYHGVWLDDHTFFGVADMHAANADMLEEIGHPTITLLPSLVAPDDIHAHLAARGRQHHSDSLRGHGVPANANLHATAVHLAKKFKHPMLKPHF